MKVKVVGTKTIFMSKFQRCLRVFKHSGGGEFHRPWSVNGAFPGDFISKAVNGTFPEQIFQHPLDIISPVEGIEIVSEN